MPEMKSKPLANLKKFHSDRFVARPPLRVNGEEEHASDFRQHRRSSHGQLHPPGDLVRESGIYEIVHDGQHRQAHEVVMIANERFPTCENCLDRVRFRLVRTAPYIFTDEDFEEQ
jgi:hypothetical protein